jgi:tetratricopeptide (TPR) repeat protein
MRQFAKNKWQLANSNWQLDQGKIEQAVVFSCHSSLALAGLIANCYLLIRRPLFCVLLFLCLNQAWLVYAQDAQDNQPQIQPRQDSSSSKSKRQPKPAPQVPENQQQLEKPVPPAPEVEQKPESSSRDSQINLDAQPREPEPPPTAGDPDDKLLLPYDPHRAEKDIEVGNYYLRLKNYRAALDRFNDALLYKPHDAEATYGLAVTEEKLDLLSQAYQNYQAYLKLLPAGPHAKEAQEGIKRLGPHADIRQDSRKEVEHDIEVGETYLATNHFDAANERFEEAVRLAPENARACFRLAQSLQGLRRIEPARLYYQKYLELEPQGRFAADAKKAIAEINDFLK